MEEPQPVQDQDPPIPQNPPVQNPEPNPNTDPSITPTSDPTTEPAPAAPASQPPAAAPTPPPASQPSLPASVAPASQPPVAAAPTPTPPPVSQPSPPAPASQPPAAAAPTPPPAPQPSPPAPISPPPPPSVPAESKKRPLDNYGPIQECCYFKMRAVVKDIRPHVLEMLRTVDFRSCKGAEELQAKLKLLMELYKQMTAEKIAITKWKTAPNSSENGVRLKPQEQLQGTADQSQPHGENQGMHIVGGSAFGWNFTTLPGSTPIYYGRTKESFRAARVTL